MPPMLKWCSSSTIKHRPARLIAQSLVIKHKLPDFIGKLFALPVALLTTGSFTLVFRSCSLRGPDCICCRAQLMRCHMRDCYRLAGRKGRKLCCTGNLSRCGVGDKGRLMGLAHGDFAPCPGVDQLNCLTRTFIVWLCFFKEMQYMLCASSRP